jgi:hypothetical protein
MQRTVPAALIANKNDSHTCVPAQVWESIKKLNAAGLTAQSTSHYG